MVGIVTVIVGAVMDSDVDDDVVEVVDEELGADDELDDELEVGDDVVAAGLVDVEPDSVRTRAAVTRLLRSTVTSGSCTPLVAGMVLDSRGTVDEGKTSVRVPLLGLST